MKFDRSYTPSITRRLYLSTLLRNMRAQSAAVLPRDGQTFARLTFANGQTVDLLIPTTTSLIDDTDGDF